ncbi:MAG: hypothetical protein KF729_19830 [Sandaracinaceae bacterium]|nr:hypothetical protein [Sandaracinaceae bacterium]
MRSLERASRAPVAPHAADGPRFALRFEEGLGRLVLARELPFALGIVDALELDLGPLRFPLDLSGGAGRFRTRRTRVRAARVRLDLPALLARLVEEPYGLAALAPAQGSLAFALRDAFGTVALDVEARFEGPHLRVVAHGARAVHDGPAPPLVRAVVAARALGLDYEEDRGAIRVERALSAVLREALVPHGWRVPDDRAVSVALEVLGPHRVALATRTDGDDLSRPGPAWERARALAPLVAHLAVGELAEARAAYAALVERGGELDARELGLSPPSGVDAVARCAALRAALREGDVDAAARAALALEQLEPCDAVAIEGLVAAAELAMRPRPALAGKLLERACERGPTEPANALRLVEVATRLGDARELARALELGRAMREPGADRAAFARDAAGLCELAGHRAEAADLYRLAHEHLPADGLVLEGLARAVEREGDLGASLDAWDRAASAWRREGDHEAEARALGAGARVARAIGDLAAAERRFAQAAVRDDRARHWAALAGVRRALDREEAAERAEDRLLAAVAREARLDEAVIDALEAATRHALAHDRVERARAWCAALRRARPEHAALEALEAAIEARDPTPPAAEPTPVADPASSPAAEPGAAVEDETPTTPPAAPAETSTESAEPEAASDAAGGRATTDAPAGTDDDGDALLSRAAATADPEARAALLDAARARFLEAGDAAGAARALARLGVLRRDTTMLRAALAAAEREGAKEIAREIVELALGVVGRGPARFALEAVRDRLRR